MSKLQQRLVKQRKKFFKKQRHPLITRRRSPKHALLRKRHKREKRFQIFGAVAIAFSTFFLATLLYTIVSNGAGAFLQTEVRLSVQLDQAMVEQERYSKIISNALKDQFPDVTQRRERRQLAQFISKGSDQELEKFIAQNPSTIGTKQDIWLLASSDIDMAAKGKINRKMDESLRRVKDNQFGWIDRLENADRLRVTLSGRFFQTADSREPELAGVLGALIGSLYVIGICVLIAFPIGVGAALYLEEFAPKNRLTDIVEVSINNLAAVPSIVYGLLALAIYLNYFELPRSSSLVGGMALSLLAMPIIIIATRNAIKSVPPSIKDAARGLGASPMQVLMHHTLPLSLPGIMTGTILSIARAVGETAPLLMIGMVAFVADVPGGIMDPATALPVQVYLWADSPELGFTERTSAAILVLLTFLILANALAVVLRKKFEYKW